MIAKNITKKIKTKIIDLEINQTELAKKLGISRQYLNLLINGKADNFTRENELKEFLGV